MLEEEVGEIFFDEIATRVVGDIGVETILGAGAEGYLVVETALEKRMVPTGSGG